VPLRRRLLVVASAFVALVGALGISAVGPAVAASSKPVSGGTVTEIYQNETTTFDPAKMGLAGASGELGYAVYGHLISFDKDLKQVPKLALSLTGNATGSTWTLKLRPNVKFSDGTALDAAAVMANMKRLADPATASAARPVATTITAMTTPDPLTLVMTVTPPDGTFDQALISNPQMNAIPSPAAVAKFGANYGKGPDTTVGAGPFVLKEWVPGDHSTYTKSSTYWEAPKKPYIDTFVIRTIIDPTARYNTFITNGGDIAMMSGAFPEVATLKQQYPFVSQPVPGQFCDAFRLDTAPTDDFLVREAIVRGADVKAAIARAVNGAVLPATGMQDPASPWYAGVKYPAYNPTKAKQDIQDYLKKTGKTSVDVDLISATSQQPLLTAMKQEWDKIPGLNVNVKFELATQTTTRILTKNYTNALHYQCQQTPRGALTQMHSSPAGPNIFYMTDAKIDAALDEANATKDPAKQTAAMKKLAERVGEVLPWIPFNFQNSTLHYQKNLKGMVMYADSVMPVEQIWKAKS
jgi:peptide/nickel transport system substrate-binding protein